jgi:hypothetical protein
MFKKQLLLVVLATLASQSLWAAQFARPASTTDSAGWSAVGAPTHHEAVDESAASDSDYIDSTNANNSTIIMGLSGVTDPGGANLDDHIVRYRCQSQGTGGPERCNIALFQGNTEIGNNGNISASRGSFTLVTWVIPDASAITNYNDLNIRVTSTSLGGGESVQVSWIELEVPDATASVPPTVTSPTFADVTETTATLGGNVTDAGSAAVTSRGVEWGTTPGGPYPNSVPEGAGGTGIFTVPVTGLPSATTIYFRAWATSTAGTGVSGENNFTTSTPATPPTVTNTAATGIGQNSATLGGDVTADGGAAVTDRGVWWSTSSPAEAGTQVPMGSGTGPFSQLVSGLPAGTQIFHKAYATNSAGTSLSGELSFTTLAGLPTVDTPTVTNITATTADLGGTVSSDGGGTVTDRGTVWGTAPNPTGNALSQGSGTGTFSHTRTGLPTGTLVYFRAYATNSAGTAYSADATFTPADVPTVAAPTAVNIGTNSADLGGTVTSDGGAALTARGTVWNTTGSPVVENALAEGGTATGTFSHSRSGMPSDTTIFYRAYATNSAGTGYSPQSQFLTDTAAETQASNLVFANKAGHSVRLTWTRGSREGVIVVMRLAATGLVGPTEGVDYTGNPDFSAPPPTTGTGNYVVYKGPGTSVLVTGLTMTTSYSVAVYEYSGTGASSSYLAGPAEATDSTTDYAVHNYDFRVNCSDCHYHGAFGARGTELKAICETCHNPSGLASAKLEFDNHTTPTKNPAIDFVDCGMCHELHNLSVRNTTESLNSVTLITQHNKSFLRANVDKYVAGAATPAYLHTDTPRRVDPHPDAPQTADNPDRAVEGGNDTSARGYCQVCHTQTNYHRSSNTAGAEQCHDGASDTSCGPAEVHCGACHEHNNNFAGAGGSCTGCHASVQGIRPVITTQFDRLSSHIPGGSAAVTQEDCEVCHDQTGHPGDQVVGLLDADGAGGPYEQTTAGASTLATGEGEKFAPACLSCHDANGASRLPGTGDQTPSSPFTGSGAPPVIDATAWSNASHNRPVATSGSSPVTCVGGGANGCHGSGHGSEQNWLLAPAGGPTSSAVDLCFNCHDSDGPSTIDIQSQFAALDAAPNVIPVTSQGGATVDNRHELTQVACNECHSPHVNNDANPVADPDTNLPLATYSSTGSYNEDGHAFSYNSGGNYDPLNPEGNPGGGFTEPDYIQFCLTCHDGTTPPGVTPTASMINIATAYNGTDQHGSGDGSTGRQTSKGGLKFPFVNSANDGLNYDPDQNYAAMNCTTCHGAHGTGSIYNLRESITVAGTVMTVGGAPGFLDEPAYAGSSTYTLPVIGSNQEDHYWGAWCTFCHKGDSHPGKVEADACTGAHMHGGGSF